MGSLHAVDLIILLVLAVVISIAVRSVIRRKGSCSCGEGGGCCGDCSHCSISSTCDKK